MATHLQFVFHREWECTWELHNQAPSHVWDFWLWSRTSFGSSSNPGGHFEDQIAVACPLVFVHVRRSKYIFILIGASCADTSKRKRSPSHCWHWYKTPTPPTIFSIETNKPRQLHIPCSTITSRFCGTNDVLLLELSRSEWLQKTYCLCESLSIPDL